jgi:phosphatidylserine/phosphatidylglycerophosphate/cardiolipin synthase-like enzyme
MSHRTIRKSKLAGTSDARSVVETILLAEALRPSEVLWIVSPWITDVVVFDNRGGAFSTLFPEAGERQIRLSEVVGLLVAQGTDVVVATRRSTINDPFLTSLASAAVSEGRLHRRESDELHEKTLAGDDFVLSGSMNFTASGLDHNEEQVRLDLAPETVSAARQDLRNRWGPSTGRRDG